jgi:hypothetical protein
MNFYPYFLYFLTDRGKIRCRMSPRNAVEQCVVHEDWHRESNTLNTDVNSFLDLGENSVRNIRT